MSINILSLNKRITAGPIYRSLDRLYDFSLIGFPGFETATDLSQFYFERPGTLRQRVNSLIRWQNVKSGSSGFVTGLGGFMTLPVAIPANLASVLFIQIRMILAIAHMGGHDLRDDRVKLLVYACLAGNVAKDILQEAGISLGTKLTANLICRISEQTLLSINKKVGFQLLAKTGGRGTINLGKAIPLMGGVIGGTFDVAMTNIIGNVARDVFIGR
jgi:uncharacterized protein (DUF697 family)